ncbi:MAG: Steroid 5-alpha reductase family enzyme [Nocardioides sp.]|nr:Steroid 5-alpha reductase family enzyme [Nocardioides sp.]
MNDVGLVLLVALATAAALMTGTALVARATGRVAVVDVAWGLGFVAIASTTALAADEGAVRRWVVLAMVAIWGCRLAWHIRRRAVGHGEDPRYEKLLGGPLREVGLRVAVRKVFLVQGLALWVTSLPVQVGAALTVRWWPVVVAGALLWLVGLVFESVGDAQLAAYKADPDRGPVMDRGLWAWTRHPNYFGDACVGWGIWLAGGLASGWLPGLLTIVAPAAMTYFLVFATGARLLESTMMKREGYPAYAERTSMFVPLPPRGRGRRRA